MKPINVSVVPSSRQLAKVYREYTPCLGSECAALLKQYEETGVAEVEDHLIESMNAARLARWVGEASKMDFTRSSRKCWSLIRRLGEAQGPLLDDILRSRPIKQPRICSTLSKLHLTKPSSIVFNQNAENSKMNLEMLAVNLILLLSL